MVASLSPLDNDPALSAGPPPILLSEFREVLFRRGGGGGGGGAGFGLVAFSVVGACAVGRFDFGLLKHWHHVAVYKSPCVPAVKFDILNLGKIEGPPDLVFFESVIFTTAARRPHRPVVQRGSDQLLQVCPAIYCSEIQKLVIASLREACKTD